MLRLGDRLSPAAAHAVGPQHPRTTPLHKSKAKVIFGASERPNQEILQARARQLANKSKV